MNHRDRRLFFDAILLGLLGAACAAGFLGLLDAVSTWTAGPLGIPVWVPIVTTLGGLVSGVLVYGIDPESEGHGTDTVVRSFHQSAGRLQARTPFVKLLASAVTIGSGGSAGREGPTALIAAGIGSLYARLGDRSDEELRLIALMAMAAGLSAVFRSPIGAAVFAVEVLYSGIEFETRALLYTLLAAVVAYAANGLIIGWDPLFAVPANLHAESLSAYLSYALLGAAAGVVATLLPYVFYRVRDGFRWLPLPRMLQPALGGLGVGLLALASPEILGGGYSTIQAAIDGHLAVTVLATLVFTKALAFSLTIGSGGSGGVFAPTLFVGAMLGALLGHALGEPTAAFAIVGMAALFAGAARVPVASLLMVTEMTGGYGLLAPAAVAVSLSYLLQRALSEPLPYRSLYQAQVLDPSDSPAHHAELIRRTSHLLSVRGLSLPSNLEPVELVPMLRAGVPVSLPDGSRLRLVAVAADSDWVGKILADQMRALEGAEIVAVLRGRDVDLPDPNLVLGAGDGLLFLAPVEIGRTLSAAVNGE